MSLDGRQSIDKEYKSTEFGGSQYGKLESDPNIRIAIKKHTKLVQCPKLTNEFLNELKIARLIDSPQIVKQIDSFESEEFTFIVMENLKGPDLMDFILKRNYVDEETAIIIIKQILIGVNHLHQSQIVHRDLKPENIKFLDEESLDLKIFDCDLSIELVDKPNTSEIIGTPEQMAPEVFGSTYYSQTADVWSIGVILYVMLSGKFPFKGINNKDTLKNILSGRIEYGQPEFDEVSLDLKELLKKMLDKDNNNRITIDKLLDHEIFKQAVHPLNENHNIEDQQKDLFRKNLDFYSKLDTIQKGFLIFIRKLFKPKIEVDKSKKKIKGSKEPKDSIINYQISKLFLDHDSNQKGYLNKEDQLRLMEFFEVKEENLLEKQWLSLKSTNLTRDGQEMPKIFQSSFFSAFNEALEESKLASMCKSIFNVMQHDNKDTFCVKFDEFEKFMKWMGFYVTYEKMEDIFEKYKIKDGKVEMQNIKLIVESIINIQLN